MMHELANFKFKASMCASSTVLTASHVIFSLRTNTRTCGTNEVTLRLVLSFVFPAVGLMSSQNLRGNSNSRMPTPTPTPTPNDQNLQSHKLFRTAVCLHTDVWTQLLILLGSFVQSTIIRLYGLWFRTSSNNQTKQPTRCNNQL
jgi:hypothetical protein